MNAKIYPNRGVGEIHFGMSKDDILALLGSPDEEFIRNPDVGYVEFSYETKGAYVSFDKISKCNAILLFPASKPELEETSILEVSATTAWETIRKLDPAATVKNESLTSMKLGASVYAPDIEEEPDDPASSVLVFAPGYFDF